MTIAAALTLTSSDRAALASEAVAETRAAWYALDDGDISDAGRHLQNARAAAARGGALASGDAETLRYVGSVYASCIGGLRW